MMDTGSTASSNANDEAVGHGSMTSAIPTANPLLHSIGSRGDADEHAEQVEGKESDSGLATAEEGNAALESSASDPTRFPCKLHRMLTEIEEVPLGLESIVSWQPHGRCFMIRDRRGFKDTVMPKYFYQLKYVSFQRQLNLYGFKKIYGQGPDKGAYYHDLFLRGKADLAGSIQRVKASKGSSMVESENSKSKSEDADINFYALPALDDKAEKSLKDREEALEQERIALPEKKSKGKRRKGKRSLNEKSDSKQEANTSAPAEAISFPDASESNPLLHGNTSNETHSAHRMGHGDRFSPSPSSAMGGRKFDSANTNENSPFIPSAAGAPMNIRQLQQLPTFAQSLMQSGMGAPDESYPSFTTSDLRMHPSLQQGNFMDVHPSQPAQSQMAALLDHAARHTGGHMGELEPTPIRPGMFLHSEKYFDSHQTFLNEQQMLHQQQQRLQLAHSHQQPERQEYDQQHQWQLEVHQQQQFLFGDQNLEQQRQQGSTTTHPSSLFQQQQHILMQQLQHLSGSPYPPHPHGNEQQHPHDSQRQGDQMAKDPPGHS